MFGDEIWDEDRWEAFLREHDRRIDRYMALLHRFIEQNPFPDHRDQSSRRDWEERLRAFLKARGLQADEQTLAFFLAAGPDDDQDSHSEEGERYFEEALGDEETSEAEVLEPLEASPLYQQASVLSSDVLRWANLLPGNVKDSALVQYCSNLTQVPANLAKGHSLGYERDTLGGNIACVKRALWAANAALDLLREMKPAAYMDAATYAGFYERTFELRNALGLYVQDLRARFDLGID